MNTTEHKRTLTLAMKALRDDSYVISLRMKRLAAKRADLNKQIKGLRSQLSRLESNSLATD